MSMMTIKKLTEEETSEIIKLTRSEFSNRMETYHFDYNENTYHEFDIDLFDVQFSKETIYNDINRLIKLFERVISILPVSIDFIVGNDDTSAAIEIYEKDWNDIINFGLFVTTRNIPDVNPYYSSEKCNAYLNFKYVSFGCMF